MKLVGLIFVALALILGVVWPWAQVNVLGKRIAELEFANFRQNWPASQEVDISATDNPVRIQFKASYEVDAKLPPVKIPIKVVITDKDGTLLTGFISFPTDGFIIGPELGKVRGSQPIDFNVLNDGRHRLVLGFAPNKNNGNVLVPDVATITASVIGNVWPLSNEHKALSAALAVAGVYLLLRSRRRKKHDKSDPPRKWGRD